MKSGDDLRGRRIAAFHEAGHTVAAWHFGIGCRAQIVRDGPGKRSRFWVGFSTIDALDKNCTLFRRAVFTWAGPIAEWLADGQIDRADLRSDSLFWVGWMADSVGTEDAGKYHVADSDWLHDAAYLYRERPARIAARILDSRYDELCEVAAKLESRRCIESRVEVT